MAERPGMMIYFDKWEFIIKESDTICSAFLRAAIEYARHGVVPDFPDGYKLAWNLIQQSIDKDKTRYDDISMSRKYARYCGTEKAAGRTPCSFDEFKQSCLRDNKIDECQHSSPTPTPTPSSTTSTTTTPSTTPCKDIHKPTAAIIAETKTEGGSEDGEDDTYDYRKATPEEIERKKQAQRELLAQAGFNYEGGFIL